MSYQEEYYKLIENQTFYHLPEQSLINFDQRVALAVLSNYKNRETNDEYETYNRYKEIKFNDILYVYKNNKEFWEKAKIENLILKEDFRQQFPEMCFQFLTDKNFLLKFFANNKNELLLESLNKLVPLEEFVKLEKSFLLSSSYGEIEKISKYEDDEDFIKKIIERNPYIFSKLSEKTQDNEEMILTYLKHEPSILNFEKEKQNKYFIPWARLHKNWDMKTIDQLDFEYLKPIMLKINKTNNEFLIQKLLSKNINKYKDVIIDFFVQNDNEEFFFKMIREKSLDDLNPVLKDLDCSSYLQKWLNNFNYKKIDKFETKVLNILKRYPDLNKQWEESFDCLVTKIVSNNDSLTFEQFRASLDIQFEKLESNLITYEKVESNMVQLKKHLPIEVLKEKKIPNNHIIAYLQNLRFTERFEEKGIKIKKVKI